MGTLWGRQDLAALRVWFVLVSMDVKSYGDSEVVRIGYGMLRSFANFDEGFMSEQQLKRDLIVILFPSFVSSFQLIDNGQASKSSIISGTLLSTAVEVASAGIKPALVHA